MSYNIDNNGYSGTDGLFINNPYIYDPYKNTDGDLNKQLQKYTRSYDYIQNPPIMEKTYSFEKEIPFEFKCQFDHTNFKHIGDFILQSLFLSGIDLRIEYFNSKLSKSISLKTEHTEKQLFLIFESTFNSFSSSPEEAIIRDFARKFMERYESVKDKLNICSRCVFKPKYDLEGNCQEGFSSSKVD